MIADDVELRLCRDTGLKFLLPFEVLEHKLHNLKQYIMISSSKQGFEEESISEMRRSLTPPIADNKAYFWEGQFCSTSSVDIADGDWARSSTIL